MGDIFGQRCCSYLRRRWSGQVSVRSLGTQWRFAATGWWAGDQAADLGNDKLRWWPMGSESRKHRASSRTSGSVGLLYLCLLLGGNRWAATNDAWIS
ncbi:hypothetical protein Dimus_020961, partial [Dionaea muscipula]